MDMAAWISAGMTFAVFEHRLDALLTGLVFTTIAFFLLERILQSYLAPYVFLKGKLCDVKGTRRIIIDVNRHLVSDVEDSGQFMTMFYLTIDRSNQNLKWVRAGHEPGIFYDPASDIFEDLKGSVIALGVSEDWQYEMNERMGLAKGQIIVLSTDGINTT